MFILPPLSLLWTLLNFFKPVPYDIVHIFSPACLPFIFLIPLFKLRRVKVYVSHHVCMSYYAKAYVPLFLFRILEAIYVTLYYLPMSIFTDLIGVPSRMADWPVFSLSRRVHIMKSGIDVQTFKPWKIKIEKKSPILVSIGRLAIEKQVDFLIRSLTHPSLQQATLVLVGDGPMRKFLVDLATELFGADKVRNINAGITTEFSHIDTRFRVIFVGMIIDPKTVSKYYALADCFLTASPAETFGFTVAEALCSGTPAVLIRSGSYTVVYEMIKDWMFEEGNMEDLALKVTKVLKQGNAAKELSRKIGVEHFSIESAVKDLLETYRIVVQDDWKCLEKGGPDIFKGNLSFY
jgi:glycosyltransferase involved in cell wall biosynthesis